MRVFDKKIILSTALTVVSLSVCGAAVNINAQSINDDLQPSKSSSSKSSRPKNYKSLKPRKKNVTAVYNKPQNTAPAPVPTETSAEIITRYMNYQQSSSVTGADWDNVVKQSNEALQANPEDKMVKAQLAIAQGQIAINRGDFSGALVQFNSAAKLMPDSVLPYYGIGKVYLSTKQPNEAQRSFEKAIKINHNFALAYKGLGDIQTLQKKPKKAQEYYQQAAQIGTASGGIGSSLGNQPNSPNVSGNPPATTTVPDTPYERDLRLARNLTAQKKWNDSLNKLQTLAASNPSTDVYILMGDNYFGMRAWLSAQQAYRKAAELNPNSALAFYKSGQVLFETNEYQASADAFEKSLILDQNGTTINRPLARKMADKAAERAKNGGKDKKKFLFL